MALDLANEVVSSSLGMAVSEVASLNLGMAVSEVASSSLGTGKGTNSRSWDHSRINPTPCLTTLSLSEL